MSEEMIGKYERSEAVPSIEAAKKIAATYGVTLDYLAGEASSSAFDRRIVDRIQDIEQLDEGEKQHVFALLDATSPRKDAGATQVNQQPAFY